MSLSKPILLLDPMEDEGYVLRYACKKSDYEIVKLLIDKYIEKRIEGYRGILKTAINTESEVRYTALQYSCTSKCPQTVKLLIEHGAGQFDLFYTVICIWLLE